MDYGNAASANSAMAARSEKPLESLACAAQRVNNATVTVQNFLDRWHGPPPECAESGAAAPAAYPHATNLERLFSALDRLEDRLVSLNAIG